MSLWIKSGPIGICDRCKTKVPYHELRADGDKPGLRVCSREECYDVKDPWKLPRPKEKPITLRYPRPDLELTVPTGYIVTDQVIGNVRDQSVFICTESGSRIVIG